MISYSLCSIKMSIIPIILRAKQNENQLGFHIHMEMKILPPKMWRCPSAQASAHAAHATHAGRILTHARGAAPADSPLMRAEPGRLPRWPGLMRTVLGRRTPTDEADRDSELGLPTDRCSSA